MGQRSVGGWNTCGSVGKPSAGNLTIRIPARTARFYLRAMSHYVSAEQDVSLVKNPNSNVSVYARGS